MTKSIQSALAALLVASAVVGGASAALAGGNYYEGASAMPLFTGRAAVASSGTTAVVNRGGEGEYFAGAVRNPVDATSTGSIAQGAAPALIPRSGDYYQGARR